MDGPSLRACPGGWIAAALIVLASLVVPAGADSIDQITVQAQRDREKLKHDVNNFVSSAIVKSWYGESLMRWDHPVCPLVAGLAREPAEFVLHRLSDIARSIHVPLGKETCKPNFIVIVAQNPSTFLNLLWRRKPRLFDTSYGIAPVKRYIELPRPVRVWYNASNIGADGGVAFTSALAESAGIGMGMVDYPIHVSPSSLGSHLTTAGVRNIESAIVVVDPQQVHQLNIGQLVDYIALVGLAQINLDKDLGEAPSILKVFNATETSPPLEMTVWDRALLHALYSTTQKSVMQLSQIQTAALKDITAKAGN
jgi:hypothetical protein